MCSYLAIIWKHGKHQFETNPAIIHRAIKNITYFINADKFLELTETTVTKVRKEIDQAVNSYVEMNIVRGCMNRDSPSVNWIANIDDNFCAPVSQTTNRNLIQKSSLYNNATIQSTYVFGGSFATQKVNPVTNTFMCTQGYSEGYNFDATESCVQECPEGFSAYAMGNINGNCSLDVCLKFEKSDDQRNLLAVALTSCHYQE
ncbi:hypothetical protein I4U23_020100 [Adineta vaga]|nr:hypothetical protein I4U23_020100 [Adineta vaga]